MIDQNEEFEDIALGNDKGYFQLLSATWWTKQLINYLVKANEE